MTVRSRPGHRRRTSLLAAALTLALVGAAAGCSSDGDASSNGDSSDEAATTRPETDDAELPEGAADLVGRWAHFDVVAYEDDLMKTLIISTGLADLELRDGELWNVQQFCAADTANDLGSEITFSDAATQAIVPVPTPVEVTEVDGALRVVRPPTPTALGIELDDPATEPLPTDRDDPRIFDADGDGKPGVTATVKVTDDLQGEIYLVRREIFSYDVTQVDPDRFEGTVTDASEQLIVGASDPLFEVEGSGWEQIDDPARNPVIWVRVDPTWDCERLAAERDELFPPNPEADW